MAKLKEKVKFDPDDAREEETENDSSEGESSESDSSGGDSQSESSQLDFSGLATMADAEVKAEKDPSFEEVLAALDQKFGPGEIFDPEKLGLEEMSEEEREEALSAMESQIRPAAEAKRQGRQPAERHGGGEIPTYRIGENGPVKIESKSDSRYCLGLQLEGESRLDFRFQRIVVVEPQRADGIPGGYPELGIPAPSTERDWLAIESGMNLGEWQREEVRKWALRYLKEEGLIPVKADPVSGVDGTPCRSFTIKAVDKGVTKALASGTEEMHYLSSLFSGGGFSGRDKDGAPLPKQTAEHFCALESEKITRITELLVGAVYGDVVDGGSPYIPAKSSEGTWKTMEGQFRAASFPGESFQRLRSASGREEALSALEEAQLSKGTLRPYKRSFVWRRIQRFWADLEEAPPAKADALYERYAGAVALLTKALYREDDTLILDVEDQIKVGAREAEGTALVTRTFLEGKPRDLPEPTGNVSGEAVFEPCYDRSPRRKQMAVYHAQAGGPKREMPVQFRIIKNPQTFQFIKPCAEKPFYEHLRKRTDELAEKICTTKGIAEIVSKQEARTREEIENGEGAVVDQDKTLLNLGIQTGAVQMESSAREKALRGGAPDPSELHMLNQLLGRFDAVLGAHAGRHLLRGLGGEAKSYLHATVEDSQQLIRRLWGIGIPSYLGEEKVVCKREYPFYDPSCCALPERITSLMNADDDGDLTQGIAAPYALDDGRIVKMVEVFRYPCVDAPIYWALPAGTKTPFDAETGRQREAYQDMLEVADPYVPEDEPDVRSDGITIAEARGMWRLSDKGAKDEIQMERIRGEITTESAFQFCERGASLNQAGPLTRDLERFGELARRARLEKKANPDRAEKFERAEEEFLARGGDTRLKTESVLSAFKYHTDEGFESPPLVPRTQTMQDPLGMGDDQAAARQILPMDYHGQIQSIERTTERFASDQETSLEGTQLTTGCRISRILQHLIDNEMPKLWETIEAIDTDPTYFTHGNGNGGLKKRLTEWYKGATEEGAQTVKAQSHKIRQAFEVWRRAWQLVIDEQNRLIREADPLEKPDLIDQLKDERQAISQALRRYMRAVAKGKRTEALQHAIFVDWGIEENTSAAGMALISDRLGEVFPRPDVTYEPAGDEEGSAVVYSHEDFPGLMFERAEVEEISLRKDGSALARVSAEGGSKTLLLHPANDEEAIGSLLPAASLTLRRVSRRRAVLSS